MSVINRIPLINEILGKLTSEQLSSLRSCINGEGATPIFRSLKPISNEHLTTSDKGVKPITIELATILGGMSAYEGYLIYTDEICYVICFSGDRNQGLNVLKINPSTCEAEFVNGSLTILELRSELDDALDNKSDGEGGGGSGSGTDVVANPELTGTEPVLTGLEVGDTKYQLPKVNLYKHSVTLTEQDPYPEESDPIDRTYKFEFISNSENKLCENANLLTFGTNYNAAFPTMINPTVHCDGYDNDPYNGDFRIVSIAGDANYLYFNAIDSNGAFIQIKIRYVKVTSQVYTDTVTPYGSSAESALNSVIKLTNAPTAANTSGRLIFVILDSDPATKYDGYFYFITGSNA